MDAQTQAPEHRDTSTISCEAEQAIQSTASTLDIITEALEYHPALSGLDPSTLYNLLMQCLTQTRKVEELQEELCTAYRAEHYLLQQRITELESADSEKAPDLEMEAHFLSRSLAHAQVALDQISTQLAEIQAKEAANESA